MGVRGLSSFSKENRQSLCQSIHLTQDGAKTREPVPVVVDAWGIIYQLYMDSLPWASGGEYLRFHRIIKRLIESWRKVGLEPVFVFDGSAPPEKHDTLIARLHENLKTSLLFHTTSVGSRSSPSFSRYSVILPPFTSQTFIHALHSLNVATHFVPTGEADGVCVSLAQKLGAYVFGNDSDFMILASSPGANQVKGYCPLDMMMWIESQSSLTDQAEGSSKDTDEWNTASSRRTMNTSKQSTLLPNTAYRSPTLVLTNISPSALRQRLRLPASHLPLLASLVGNDYVPVEYVDSFFEPGLSVVQRIEKVARVLREQIFSPSSSPRVANAGDQAVELVKRVVAKLTVRGFVSDAVMSQMVDTIIEATFQYILPDLNECCTAFPFCGGLDGQCQTNDETLDPVGIAKGKYAAVQRRGMLSNVTHAYLFPNRIYLWTILEDPTGPSLRASERLREVRKAAWGIIEATCDGMKWPEPIEEELSLHEDKAEQPSLGTNAEEEARAGGSGGTSEDLTLVEDERNSEEKSLEALLLLKSRAMVEYVRQGSSSRISATSIALDDKQEEDPPCLLPIEARLQRYLQVLSSDTALVGSLPVHLQPLLAITRFAILETPSRAYGKSYGRYDSAKLRRTEVLAILKAGIGMYSAWNCEGKVYRPNRGTDDGGWPLLTPRNAGIVAQINAIALDSLLLAESLLLVPEDGDTMGGARLTHLTPFVFVSGVALHSLLQDTEPPVCTGWKWMDKEEALLQRCAEAVIEGIEDEVLGWSSSPQKSIQGLEDTPMGSKPRKDDRRKVARNGNTATSKGGGGSRFDLLAGVTI